VSERVVEIPCLGRAHAILVRWRREEVWEGLEDAAGEALLEDVGHLDLLAKVFEEGHDQRAVRVGLNELNSLNEFGLLFEVHTEVILLLDRLGEHRL